MKFKEQDIVIEIASGRRYKVLTVYDKGNKVCYLCERYYGKKSTKTKYKGYFSEEQIK